MKGYIYKYTFPDGKVYIGQTRRLIEMRHAEHLNPSTGPFTPGFWEAYQKVCTPVLNVVETVDADDVNALVNQLNCLETAYIFKEKATDPAFGYNRRALATSCSPDISILNREISRMCHLAEEEKRPFFDSLTEKLFYGDRNSLTEEEKAFVEGYIEQNNLFAHSGEENEVPDEESFMDEEDDIVFEHAVEYAIWLYNEETREIIGRYIAENAEEIIRKAKQGKIIQQLDMEGNVIKEFETQDDIRVAFNLVRIDNIINVIKGRQKSAYGFRWRYKPV